MSPNNIARMMQQAAVAQPAPQQTVLSTPFNDTQLIAMIAVQCIGPTAEDRVEHAIDLVVEAVVAVNTGKLSAAIEAKRRSLIETT